MQEAQENKKQNFNRRYYETIRRAGILANLGRMAIRGSHLEGLQGYEHRQYDEVHSAFVEGLKGTVSTHYTFKLRNSKLVARDGEDIEYLLERGVDDANEMATEDSFYADFLPRRAQAELNEHLENQSMATGLADYNTNITFSAFTEEKSKNKDIDDKLVLAAQKPYSRRAMIRVSHWDGQELHVFTRSIDQSSVKLLKETAHKAIGHDFSANDSTEMLEERIHLKIQPDKVESLTDYIISTADSILAKRQGGDWKQGRPANNAKNLEAFVDNNNDVVLHLLGVGRQLSLEHDNYESYKQAFENELYKHLALLETRLEYNETAPIVDIEAAATAAGAIAESEGRSFDMCGMVINASGQTDSLAAQTGYESLKRLEGKKISCPECKSKVVVPKKDLEAGKLTCSDCGYEVDVCTGKSETKKRPSKQGVNPSFFDVLAADLQKYAEEARQKQETARQK